MVVPLQTRAQRPENGEGCLLGGLLHHHRPEPPFQRRVLLNILAVFVPGCCPQHLQFPPAQGRFEDIRRVDGSLGGACSHDGVHFIHKENHIAAAADFRKHIPQPFLKFPPVFGPRHQRRHVQAHEPFFLQLGRHVSHGHPLGQALGDGGFTYPRLPHQSRIVLTLPAQDAHHHIDFPFPSDDRLHACRLGHQILAELLQQSQRNSLLFSLGQRLPLPL